MRSCLFAVTLLLVGMPKVSEADNLFDYLFGKPVLKAEWTHKTGIFNESTAEIVAYDYVTHRVFVTNSGETAIDVLDARSGEKQGRIDVDDWGAPTCVSAHQGLVAIAINSDKVSIRGRVLFVDAKSLDRKGDVEVGFLPDNLRFSPDGQWVVVANEGQPSEDYAFDPEGSVSVISVGDGTNSTCRDADFRGFNEHQKELMARGVRVFGPGSSLAQDVEPEYVAISKDSSTAFVSLQENNALAVVDLKTAKVLSVESFGLKDHSLNGNGLDASNKDDKIRIHNWPVFGMYQPDSIATRSFVGQNLLFTANEGDARDYEGFSEEMRVKDLTLDEATFPQRDELQQNENLGRLKSTSAGGDLDGDGDVDRILAYGARSFSIWSVDKVGAVKLLFDSGDEFEKHTAAKFPEDFNCNSEENDSFDNRSDDKGPEPEALAIGKDLFQSYCWIGLERMGGVMVYETTNPFSPRMIEYKTNRNFAGDPESGTAGDLAPEGIVFVPRGRSPFREPVLVVTSEVSGTTTLYRMMRTGGLLSSFCNGR